MSNKEETGEQVRKNYSKADFADLTYGFNIGLGCGNPVSIAALKRGEVVLDLGCGGGLDCFLARRQVGETGHVIGVDLAPEMIRLARENALKGGYSNVEFRLGEIENLPAADSTVDVIISNCVINLCADKKRVYKEAYRVLKAGGRLSVSDIVANAELPDSIRNEIGLKAGCIAGAEQAENIRAILKSTGFKDIKLEKKDDCREILSSWMPDKHIEDFVASYAIEAVK